MVLTVRNDRISISQAIPYSGQRTRVKVVKRQGRPPFKQADFDISTAWDLPGKAMYGCAVEAKSLIKAGSCTALLETESDRAGKTSRHSCLKNKDILALIEEQAHGNINALKPLNLARTA